MLFPDQRELIAGQDVPLVLLGDPAYPLLPWLMKAFPNNGRLSQEQKTFNYSLSKARVVEQLWEIEGKVAMLAKETGC